MNFDCRTIFVGDLPNFVTDGDLRVLFASFGPIVDVQVHNGMETGRTSSYAFVTLGSFAAIEAARKHLDGCVFLGKRIRLRRATVMHPKGMSGSSSPPAVNSVYVRFVSSIVDHSITEFDLHRIFSLHGLVEDVIVKDCSIDLQAKQQFGYAFVHFASRKDGVQAAFQSVAALDRATVEGITFHVEVSRNLLKQFGHQYGHAAHQAIPYQSPSHLPRHHLSRPLQREKATSPRDSSASLHRSASGFAFPNEPFPASLRFAESGVMTGKQSSLMNPGIGVIREAHGNMRDFHHYRPHASPSPFPVVYQPIPPPAPAHPTAVAETHGTRYELGAYSARGGFVSRSTEAAREPLVSTSEWWGGHVNVPLSLLSYNAVGSSKLPSGDHSLPSLPWDTQDSSDARTVSQWSYADDAFSSSPSALSLSVRVGREPFLDDSETNLLHGFSLEKLSLCEEAEVRGEREP
eukprot:gene11099-12363_t